MKKNLRFISFLPLFVFTISACRILDTISLDQTAPNVKVVPTLTPSTAGAVDTTKGNSEVNTGNVENGGNEGAVLYKSPAGYQLAYPAEWSNSNMFGQTILTNDSALLETGELGSNQTVFIAVAGSVRDSSLSAEAIMLEVQQDVLAGYLADGSLTELDGVESDSNGVRASYRLSNGDNDDLFVQTASFVNQNLFVVSISMMHEADRGLFEEQTDEIIGSLILTADRYLADANTPTQAELQDLNQELANMVQLPETVQGIELGETVGQVGGDGVTVFEFSADSDTVISLAVTPENSNFDLTIDILDSDNVSILPDGLMDNGSAGDAESIEDLQLPAAGSYRIVVRGFGFSSGAFALDLAESG